jgi:RimJ/RimL family protein N-acetyltransferase
MNLTLRDCIFEDAHTLLRWRNSGKVRYFSRNSDVIDSKSHEDWLLERLTEIRTQPFWIIVSNEESAGFLRFDHSKKYPGAFDVSILIGDEYQGLGIAQQILSSAIKRVRKDFKSYSIYAEVHVDNIASVNLFKKCRFELISEAQNFSTFKFLTAGA